MKNFLLNLVRMIEDKADDFVGFAEDKILAFLAFFAGIENVALRIVAFVVLGVLPFLLMLSVAAAIAGIIVAVLLVFVAIGMCVDVLRGKPEFFR